MEKDICMDRRSVEEEISGLDRRNGRTLVGTRPDREKEILGFFKEIFLANFNHFSGIFRRLSRDYMAKQEERKFCVLEKMLFYEFLEEDGK